MNRIEFKRIKVKFLDSAFLGYICGSEAFRFGHFEFQQDT